MKNPKLKIISFTIICCMVLQLILPVIVKAIDNQAEAEIRLSTDCIRLREGENIKVYMNMNLFDNAKADQLNLSLIYDPDILKLDTEFGDEEVFVCSNETRWNAPYYSDAEGEILLDSSRSKTNAGKSGLIFTFQFEVLKTVSETNIYINNIDMAYLGVEVESISEILQLPRDIEKYDITYNDNLGEEGILNIPDDDIKFEQYPYQIPELVPEKEGYTFIEWNTEEDGSGLPYMPGDIYELDEPLDLHAQWNCNTSTLTIDLKNGIMTDENGNRVSNTVQYSGEYKDEIVINDPVSNARYIINYDSNFGKIEGKNFNRDRAIAEEEFIGWEEEITNGTFENGTYTFGLQHGGNDRLIALYEQDEIELPNAIREGYTFKGWYTESIGGEKIGNAYEIIKPTKSLNLHAQWQNNSVYEVTYVKNTTDDVFNMPNIEEKIGEEDYVVSSNIPEREGYTFIEWNTSADAAGDTYVAEDIYSIDENLVLYAIWESNARYNIVYNSNTENEVINMPENELKIGEEDYVISSNIPEREGYTFIEWNTSADATGDTYVAENIYSVDEDLTLYAIWESNARYNIVYNSNTQAEVTNMPENEIKIGEKDYIISDDIPEREGYAFVAWNTSENGIGEYYISGDKYNNDQDLTLYAIWENTGRYNITYKANTTETVNNMPRNDIKRGEYTYIIPENIPERENYEFKEWNTKADGTGVSYNPNSVYDIDARLILYAIWDYTATYDIIYNENISVMPENMPEDASKTYNYTYSIANEIPQVEGFRFVEWNTLADGSGDKYIPGQAYEINESLTLYAIWTRTSGELYLSSFIYKIGYNDTENYENGDSYIYNIDANTTIDKFISNLSTNGNIEIIENDDEYIGTGMILKVTKENKTIELRIAVRGDLNGDGKVSISDLSTVNKNLLGKVELENEYAIAADINENGYITITDLSAINKMILK